MSTVSVMTGTGRGSLLSVNEDGSIPVDEIPLTVYRTYVTALNTSGTLLDARPGRRVLRVQVQGPVACYLRFENAAATNQDWMVAAGGEFRLDRYEGIVTVIAPLGNSNVLALELAP